MPRRGVYDSADPNLPNLPDRDDLSWSDYDYLTDNESSSSSSSTSTSSSSSASGSSMAPSMLRNLMRSRMARSSTSGSNYSQRSANDDKKSERHRKHRKESIGEAILARILPRQHRNVRRALRRYQRRRHSLFDNPIVRTESSILRNKSTAEIPEMEAPASDSILQPRSDPLSSSSSASMSRSAVPKVVIQPTEEHTEAAGGKSKLSDKIDKTHLKPAPTEKSTPSSHTASENMRNLTGKIFGKTNDGSKFPGILDKKRILPMSTSADAKSKFKRRSRRYLGSQAKRERAAWEPGVDVHTTNVLLRTPGSTVTITDYSEKRYRVERYEVYSEMAQDHTRYDKDSDHVEFYSKRRNSSLLSSDSDGSDEDTTSSMNELYETASQYLEQVDRSKNDLEKAFKGRPKWSKVRWINVNGLSWEAISLIGDHYNLHRLAIEDMVDIPQRTKVDMYPGHLFAVLPLLKLITMKTPLSMAASSFVQLHLHHRKQKSSRASKLPVIHQPGRSVSSEAISPTATVSSFNPREDIPVDLEKNIRNRKYSLHASRTRSRSQSSRSNLIQFKTLNEMIMDDPNARTLTESTLIPVNKESEAYKKVSRIESRRPLYRRNLGVGQEQLSIFLTDNGTVISFLEHSANDIEKAILPRLSSEYTLLRTSCDPSILFESIVDASVDLIYPVVTAYNKIMNEFEVEILTNPGMQRTAELHLMVNELTLLRSTIQPISSMVLQVKNQKIFRKFISENSTLYLSDIDDHLISYVQSLDSMTQTIENLLNLVFNILSVETNSSMQRLSLITVIFLPLTFWTGYYGMNFEKFSDLERDVSFYWELSVPFCIGLMIIIMRKELKKYLQQCYRYILRAANNYFYKRSQEDAYDSDYDEDEGENEDKNENVAK
ncbi:hypothetical protein HII12_001852 [Brettanomyces bruxellensis]|uniref:Uncharacterized protein n=1 Tax=Dekkera bruxellensis TaxID=5007 RepID=A0A8H6BKL4_DEKBR|nr:hypothetical protein HII12_001852 [Brettanomyces bruxellensis]